MGQEQQNIASGFPNLSNLNPEGLGDEYGKNIDAIQKTLDDLEARYQQPNWFKIAAGFAKPQLGGFVASLGSAADAMGENIEQQRRLAIPLAQMRAQLGVQSAVMGQNKAAADYLDNWQKDHPGQQVPQDVYEHAASISPNTPRVQAVGKSLEVARGQQQLTAQQQATELQRLTQGRATNTISDEEYQAGMANLAKNSPFASSTNLAPPKIDNVKGDVNAPAAPAEAGATQNPAKPKGDAVSIVSGLGIPIISGDRTTQKQQEIWDESVAAGRPGITPKGNPIAKPGSSQHEQGNAVDIDTASLTKDQKDQLKAAGFIQPLLSTDPNHWEKVPAKKELVPSTLPALMNPTPDSIKARDRAADRNEERSSKRYDSLESIAGDENYNAIQRTVNNQLDLMKNPANHEAVRHISGVFSQGGLLNAVLKSVDTGIGFSINGINGQLSAPIEQFIRNKFPENEQDLARTMAMNYATIALAQQKMGGVNANSARNQELHLYSGLSPNIDTTPNASIRSLLHFRNDLDNTRAQYKFVSDLDQDQHPQYMLDPKSHTRLTDAFRHKDYTKLSEPFNEENKKIEAAYQRQLNSLKQGQ